MDAAGAMLFGRRTYELMEDTIAGPNGQKTSKLTDEVQRFRTSRTPLDIHGG
jgi:hypothetical protein